MNIAWAPGTYSHMGLICNVQSEREHSTTAHWTLHEQITWESIHFCGHGFFSTTFSVELAAASLKMHATASITSLYIRHFLVKTYAHIYSDLRYSICPAIDIFSPILFYLRYSVKTFISMSQRCYFELLQQCPVVLLSCRIWIHPRPGTQGREQVLMRTPWCRNIPWERRVTCLPLQLSVHQAQFTPVQAPFCLYFILFYLFIYLFMYLFPGVAHINMIFPEVTPGDSSRRHHTGTWTQRGHVWRLNAVLEQEQRQDLQSDI